METLQRMANRGSISTGYDIDNSCKFENDNSEGLVNNYSGDGDRKTWTFSGWVKRSELGVDQHIIGAAYSNIRFMTNDLLRVELYDGSATRYADLQRLFRDTSAWYHIVVALDSTQGTAANRVKIYINGVQDTAFDNSTYTNMSEDDEFNFGEAASNFQVGYSFVGGANFKGFCGYFAEFHYTDGVANDADAFGEFDEDTGIWKPKAYAGSHGSKGIYFKFDDSSALGANSASGGVGDFTESNIAAADQATDTPTNNFCIMSPLWNYANDCVISDGGSYIDGSAAAWNGAKATFGLTAGKWYWEIKQLGSGGTFMGLQTDGDSNISSGNAQSHNISVVFYTDGTLQYSGGSESTTSASNSITTNSIVGFALDLDSGTQTIKIYLDGSLITTFGSSGTCNLSTYNIEDTTVFPFVAIYENTVNMNFGGYTRSSISSAAADANGYGTFEYAPPSGYYALCTKNLSEFGG